MSEHSIPAVMVVVLRQAGRPLLPGEILQQVQAQGLYSFKAKDPLHIVTSQLRRHCIDLDFPSARPVKWFRQTADGRYEALAAPQRMIAPPLYEVTNDTEAGSVTLVSVPPDEQVNVLECPNEAAGPTHTEMQWRLLDLGSQLGFQIWAPIPDRGLSWQGKRIADVKGMVSKLPLSVSAAVRKTIEFIDVLWLDQQAIVSGFEVEHTTPIYSGLLRLSDLLTLSPNFRLKMFIVAASERLEQFAGQVNRPTFSMRRSPALHEVCRFLAYEHLLERLDEAKGFIKHLKPGFLDDLADSCGPTDGEAES
jgi:hypothetical protein